MGNPPSDDEQCLRGLADALAQRRLLTPARILLDMIAPLGMIAGQMTLFVRPLLPSERLRRLLAPLEEEAGWRTLQRILCEPDS